MAAAIRPVLREQGKPPGLCLISGRRACLKSPVKRLWIATALAAASMTAPGLAHAQEPERVINFDPNAYPPSSARTGLILGGLATTAVWYGATTGVSYLWPDAPGAEQLRIPVAGPWLALGETGCPEGEPDCGIGWVVFRATLTTLSGIAQFGGVYVALEGVMLPTAPPKEQNAPPAKSTFRVAPVPIVAGSDGVGLGLVGQF
jgi:hypothetical protein